ncbi:MAG: hypothetical protein RLZZ142_2359 [Verrucomicrobiota bacterium]|jgi:YbgC/YbaW family acyl-CoA thioester hydrolase
MNVDASCGSGSKRGMEPPFVFQRRIEFAETDMAGIVHFSNFFRMMEAAEHAFLRSLGASVHGAGEGGSVQGWPRVRATCEYLKPLRFEQCVEIEVRVAEVRNRSVCYQFGFRRPGEGEWVARGEVVAVFARVDPSTGQLGAQPIPEPLRSALLERAGG